MTELRKSRAPVCLYTRINRKYIGNELLCIFKHLTARSPTDGKQGPLTAFSLQAVGSPKEAPPTYIAKLW